MVVVRVNRGEENMVGLGMWRVLCGFRRADRKVHCGGGGGEGGWRGGMGESRQGYGWHRSECRKVGKKCGCIC